MPTIIGAVSLIIVAFWPFSLAAAAESDAGFSSEFPLQSCRFVPWGGNAYFRLSPGEQRQLSNSQCVDEGDCDQLEEVWITVKHDIRRIPVDIGGRTRTVWTRVVEELESVDGILVEASENYFATCWGRGDVYYFGEQVSTFHEGDVINNDGAWLAGVRDARPGLMMPQLYQLGARYFQELAPGVALDRAEHVASDLSIDLPAGEYRDCVEVEETSPLEPGEKSTKIYCPDVGLVVDEDLQLTTYYD